MQWVVGFAVLLACPPATQTWLVQGEPVPALSPGCSKRCAIDWPATLALAADKHVGGLRAMASEALNIATGALGAPQHAPLSHDQRRSGSRMERETISAAAAPPAAKRQRVDLGEGGAEGLPELPHSHDDQSCSVLSSEWALPPAAGTVLLSQGIRKLHAWQRDCLRCHAKGSKTNLVVRAPTSGGKSLVGDMLLLRRLHELPGTLAMVVLPYQALVREKAANLAALAAALDGCGAQGAASSAPKVKAVFGHKGGSRFGSAQVVVTTPERALGIVAQLCADEANPVAPGLSSLSFVCVDEVHVVGDSSRGGRVEVLLTLLLHASRAVGQPPPTSQPRHRAGHCPIQIVAMSATMPNVQVVAAWLRATPFTATHRPSTLHQYTVLQGHVYACRDPRSQALRVLSSAAGGTASSVPAALQSLARETAVRGQHCLVFCASKAGVRRTALSLATALQQGMASTPWRPSDELRSLLDLPIMQSLDAGLRGAFAVGVGVHHASLEAGVKEVMQGAFERRALHTLCATTSLAAGVNLPAHRVIVTALKVGIATLDATRYQQMVGRAGRFGLAAGGEAYVLARTLQDRRDAAELALAGAEPLLSRLLPARMEPVDPAALQSASALFTQPAQSQPLWITQKTSEQWSLPAAPDVQRLLLAGVSAGLVVGPASLRELLQCTFAASLGHLEPLQAVAVSTLSRLLQERHVCDSRHTTAKDAWREAAVGTVQAKAGCHPVELARRMGATLSSAWLDMVARSLLERGEALAPLPCVGDVQGESVGCQTPWLPSDTGSAAFASSLTGAETSVLLNCAHVVLRRQNLASQLQPVFLICPVLGLPRVKAPPSLFSRYCALPDAERGMVHEMGIGQGDVLALQGIDAVPPRLRSAMQRLQAVLMLYFALHGARLAAVARWFGFNQDDVGEVQGLVSTTFTFAGSVKRLVAHVLPPRQRPILTRLIDHMRRQLKGILKGKAAKLAATLRCDVGVTQAVAEAGLHSIPALAAAHPSATQAALLAAAPWALPDRARGAFAPHKAEKGGGILPSPCNAQPELPKEASLDELCGAMSTWLDDVAPATKAALDEQRSAALASQSLFQATSRAREDWDTSTRASELSQDASLLSPVPCSVRAGGTLLDTCADTTPLCLTFNTSAVLLPTESGASFIRGDSAGVSFALRNGEVLPVGDALAGEAWAADAFDSDSGDSVLSAFSAGSGAGLGGAEQGQGTVVGGSCNGSASEAHSRIKEADTSCDRTFRSLLVSSPDVTPERHSMSCLSLEPPASALKTCTSPQAPRAASSARLPPLSDTLGHTGLAAAQQAPVLAVSLLMSKLPAFACAERWSWCLGRGSHAVKSKALLQFASAGETNSCSAPGQAQTAYRVIVEGSACILRGVTFTWADPSLRSCVLTLPPPIPRRPVWEGLHAGSLPYAAMRNIASFTDFGGQDGCLSSTCLAGTCRAGAAAVADARAGHHAKHVQPRWGILQRLLDEYRGQLVIVHAKGVFAELLRHGVQPPAAPVFDPAVAHWMLDTDAASSPSLHALCSRYGHSLQPHLLDSLVSSGSMGEAQAAAALSAVEAWLHAQATLKQHSKPLSRFNRLAPDAVLAQYPATAFAMAGDMLAGGSMPDKARPTSSVFCVQGTWTEESAGSEAVLGAADQHWVTLARPGTQCVPALSCHSGAGPPTPRPVMRRGAGMVPGWDGRDVAHQRGCVALVVSAALRHALQAGGLLQPLLELEMPARLVMASAEVRGMAADKRLLVALHTQVKESRHALDSAAARLVPSSRRLSLASERDVCTALEDMLAGREGPVPVSFTSAGLERLANDATVPFPARCLAAAVLQMRVLAPMGSCLSSLLAAVAWEGSSSGFRVFPVSNAFSATGRVGLRKPNLQMLPKATCIRLASTLTVHQELRMGLLPPAAAVAGSAAACLVVNAAASHAKASTAQGQPRYPVLRPASLVTAGGSVALDQPSVASGPMSTTLTPRGQLDLRHAPLAQYWEAFGFPYPDPKSVSQVLVRFGQSPRAPAIAVPADQVQRRMGARFYDLAALLSPPEDDTDSPYLPLSHCTSTLNLRLAMCASPGRVLLAVDFSQVELRVLAHLSQDDTLLQLLRSGTDVFLWLTQQWRGVCADLSRAAAKALVYGMLYGMQGRQLGAQMGIPTATAMRLQGAFLQQFPGVRALFSRTVAQCRRHGFVTTLLGRRRYLPDIRSAAAAARARAERQAVNTICQGSAADLLKTSLVAIQKALSSIQRPVAAGGERWVHVSTRREVVDQHCAHLVLHIHDEVVLDVPEEPAVLQTTAQAVRQAMVETTPLSVPLVVKMEVGKTWGAMSPFDPDEQERSS